MGRASISLPLSYPLRVSLVHTGVKEINANITISRGARNLLPFFVFVVLLAGLIQLRANYMRPFSVKYFTAPG